MVNSGQFLLVKMANKMVAKKSLLLDLLQTAEGTFETLNTNSIKIIIIIY